MFIIIFEQTFLLQKDSWFRIETEPNYLVSFMEAVNVRGHLSLTGHSGPPLKNKQTIKNKDNNSWTVSLNII